MLWPSDTRNHRLEKLNVKSETKNKIIEKFWNHPRLELLFHCPSNMAQINLNVFLMNAYSFHNSSAAIVMLIIENGNQPGLHNARSEKKLAAANKMPHRYQRFVKHVNCYDAWHLPHNICLYFPGSTGQLSFIYTVICGSRSVKLWTGFRIDMQMLLLGRNLTELFDKNAVSPDWAHSRCHGRLISLSNVA